jgi:phospholipase C
MSILNFVKGLFRRAVPDSTDPIKHVIVLMFENHSFDQMLGCFWGRHPKLAGVDPANPNSNEDSGGRPYSQQATDDSTVRPDPKHDLADVQAQLDHANGGFVLNYEKAAGANSDQRQQIMDYFRSGSLPALHQIADQFTICDHWYASVPGPTWANRFFVHSGTSMGRVAMPEGWNQAPQLYLGYDQDTIYDRLNEQNIRWRIYHGDVPQSLLMSHQRKIHNAIHYRWLDEFFNDVARPEAAFPEYVFIEPNYFHVPGEQPQNDDHPPHSTKPAQALLAKVYNSIRQNEALWNSTLLVVVYDEHGGFYDHVSPPAADPPDGHLTEYTFDRYGVRVPAVLVSPWVGMRVLGTVFDHTSLLKYLIDKWRLKPLTNRVSKANSIGEAILKSAQPMTPSSISIGDVKLAAPAGVEPAEPLNDYQKAMFGFTEYLAANEIEQPAAEKFKAMAAELPTDAHRARQRIGAFLDQQRAKAAGQA